MSETRWRGTGPGYELSWSGRTWHLELEGARPGLRLAGSDRTSLLTLDGLSVRGRSCLWQIERPKLSKFESLFDRVEATYTLPAWGGLTLRAAWGSTADRDGVDLEIQILADSVDFLKGVEVLVVTELCPSGYSGSSTEAGTYDVEPRDRESAALSYDGREPSEVLQSLRTLPIPGEAGTDFDPIVHDTPWLDAGSRYVEFVHPDDVARRIVWRPRSSEPGPGSGAVIRYGIFGHDLEKGVLLRSRMRGFWARGPLHADELAEKFREFREGPLPLGP